MNSKRLFYRNGDRMMAVDIETEPSFRAGEPKLLFDRPFHSLVFGSTYDRSPIDDRFAMITTSEDLGKANELVIVENWFEELKAADPLESEN